MISTISVGSSSVIDYLTCGSCLKEFPLQKITAFIQHKKLDCDDETDVPEEDPELQCNYCLRGFMTAWGLLVHAQITHNLKIFLEKASKSFIEQTKLSPSPDSYVSDSKLSAVGYGSVQSDKDIKAESLRPNVSDLVSVCVSNAVFGTPLQTQSNTGKNIFVTTDYIAGNRNVFGRGKGSLLREMSQTESLLHRDTTLEQVNNTEQTNDNVSVQVHQKIIAVPCRQVITSKLVAQKSLEDMLEPYKQVSGPFRSRSQTLPSIPSLITDAGSSQIITPSQDSKIVNISNSEVLKEPTEIQEIRSAFPQKPENTDAEMETFNESMDKENKEILVKSSSLQEDKMGRPSDAAINTQGNFIDNGQLLDLSKQSVKTANVSSLIDNGHSINAELDSIAEAENNVEEQDDDNADNDRVEPCCDNQGCGITVIPGSHQILQKCCNAVVPKKRKRHFETKHMPFSWSSSRYAKRRMLQSSRERQFSGSSKSSGSTIYIDVEPESFVSEAGNSSSSSESTLHVTQTHCTSPRVSSSERVLTSQGKTRSLILKPGAVFSIPLTYTIPSSKSSQLPMPTTVPQQPSGGSSLDSSESHDDQTGTESSSRTLQSVNQSSSAGENDIANVSDQLDIKPVLEEARRRKYPTSKPFKCEMCSLAFNQRIHLKKHMSKHTGIKPYKCGQCDYSTVERSHLKVHIRIHTGEKPFKCTYCEYATAQNSTLKIHLKRHHGGRMFQCQSCDKKFTQQTQLNDHKWEHSPPDSSTRQANRVCMQRTLTKTENSEDQPYHTETSVASTSSQMPSSDQQKEPANSSTDLGHVISIPSASMTDNEAAALLNSFTAKLLEEAEQASQGNTDAH